MNVITGCCPQPTRGVYTLVYVLSFLSKLQNIPNYNKYLAQEFQKKDCGTA